MTIPLLEVNLQCFADGQAYVALSRAVTLENVRILAFDKTKVKVNKDALAYMEA